MISAEFSEKNSPAETFLNVKNVRQARKRLKK
jgi:hypothetical protein